MVEDWDGKSVVRVHYSNHSYQQARSSYEINVVYLC